MLRATITTAFISGITLFAALVSAQGPSNSQPPTDNEVARAANARIARAPRPITASGKTRNVRVRTQSVRSNLRPASN